MRKFWGNRKVNKWLELIMRTEPVIFVIGALLLGGCANGITSQSTTRSGGENMPKAVLDLAGPGQDLSTARLLPEDGCYWYEHRGPVESTLLPLRTAGGKPICTASET